MVLFRKNRIALIVNGALLMSFGAYAQENQEPESSNAKQDLEVITVTSRFREQSVQEVGGSVSALHGNGLAERNIRGVQDLVNFTVGLNAENRGPNRNDVNIRGIGRTLSPSDALATPLAVGSYVDEISINTLGQAGVDVRSFDLNRVEVLRGPQGTLYGESAPGGALRYFTQNPDLSEIEGKVELSYNTISDGGNGFDYKAAISVPIVEDYFAIRAVINHEEIGGFIDDVAGNENINEYEVDNYRVVALAKPTDVWTSRLSIMHEDADFGVNWFVGGNVEELTRQFDTSDFYNLGDYTLYSFKNTFQFDTFSIESITGRYERDISTKQSSGIVNGALFERFTTVPAGFETISLELTQTTQEFRFISDFDGSFNFVAGLFYRDIEQDYTNLDFRDPAFPLAIIDNATYFINSENQAVFFEGTWSMKDDWRLIFGARYHDEALDVNIPEGISLGNPLPEVNGEAKVQRTLPKFAIEHDINDDAMTYFSYSTGLRNGNTNSGVTLASLAAAGLDINPFFTYGEDYLKAYEFGLKTRLADGAVVANFAAFLNDWEDMQLLLSLPEAGGTNLVDNIGQASSKGAEVELTWQANDYIDTFLNVAYSDAKIDEDISVNAIGSMILEGTPLSTSPELTLSGGVVYENVLGNSEWYYALRANFAYIDESVSGIQILNSDGSTLAGLENPSYLLANVGVNFNDGNFNIDLSINNVFDEIEQTGAFEFGSPPKPLLTDRTVTMPRTIRLTVSYEF
jgi:outer membrane receptor protein involved in Fe transport